MLGSQGAVDQNSGAGYQLDPSLVGSGVPHQSGEPPRHVGLGSQMNRNIGSVVNRAGSRAGSNSRGQLRGVGSALSGPGAAG